MAANDRFELLLSRLYEAALEPALWPAVWAEATAAAGGIAPSLLVVADNDGLGSAGDAGLGRALLDDDCDDGHGDDRSGG